MPYTECLTENTHLHVLLLELISDQWCMYLGLSTSLCHEGLSTGSTDGWLSIIVVADT